MLGRNQQVQVKMDSNNLSDADKEFGFEWCFKPYIVILKLLTGAPVDRPSNSQGQEKEQQHRSICSCLALYGVLLLVINGSISTNYVKEYIGNNIMGQGMMSNVHLMADQQHPPPSNIAAPLIINQSILPDSKTSIQSSANLKTNKTADLLSMSINMVNEVFIVFGPHLCFFIISYALKTSTRLWDLLLKIENQLVLTTAIYHRIRSKTISGLVLLSLCITSNILLGIVQSNPLSENVSPYVAISINVAKILGTTILMWFFILVRTVVVLFEVLKQRMEAMVEIGLNVEKVAEDLKAWKKHHSLVCQLVTCINQKFGIILVIAFAHGFVSFITNFYRFFSTWQTLEEFNLPYLFIFIEQALFLSIFIIASYCLQTYGPKLSEATCKLDVPSDVGKQNLLNSVLVQVTQANARITAADLFDVNLTLFPVILGTTLTYVIILIQQN